MHKFPYKWTLADAVFTKDKGSVFSCFACGGGSTMGYKLAGFDVLGCNEIDPKMIAAYKANHKPKYAFLEPIQTFKLRKDLPVELYNLDILDGSPPCSSFSMAGNREKDWGKDKVFREGQKKQVLDTLFFDFIDLAKELKPKIVVAENVKGILLGQAKKYMKAIFNAFDDAGYYCKVYLFNAAKMGVPQRRERVFFLCLRKDLLDKVPKNAKGEPNIEFGFDEPEITFNSLAENYTDRPIKGKTIELWNNRQDTDKDLGAANGRLYNKPNNYFGWPYLKSNMVANTIIANDTTVLYDSPRHLNKNELCKIGTYPIDYNFKEQKPHYLIGMSVPPVMTAQIASRIYDYWLKYL